MGTTEGGTPIDPSMLPSLVELERELSSRRLANYIKLAWHVLEPRTPLVWGWAMDAVAEHLEAVTEKQITRLLINVPPGFMKSLQTCVFWPSWNWGPRNDPSLRIIGSSHAADFSTRDTGRFRDLVMSPWYQRRWGHLFSLTKEGEQNVANDRRGWRKGVPFSSMTGERADHVIIDDPHSTEGAESDADRVRAVRIFRESISTRTSDLQAGAIVVIMQRLHDGDISGEILEKEFGYEHLMLPMEYEAEHPHKTVTSIGFGDPRKEEGELLDPVRFPRESLEGTEGLKAILGSHAVAGQLQQRPGARGGNIVKRDCFRNTYAARGSRPLRTLQSWDTAGSTKSTAARSCCLTVAEFEDRLELWHVFSERLRFGQLQAAAEALNAEWKPDIVVVEGKSTGGPLVDQLEDETMIPVRSWDPGRLDKDSRLFVVTPRLEAGALHLPADMPPWAVTFITRVCAIPTGKDRDEGDALSQLLMFIRDEPVPCRSARVVVSRKRSNRAGRFSR